MFYRPEPIDDRSLNRVQLSEMDNELEINKELDLKL
ncbi:hypothetical protein PALU110988_19880 [Paenibacillus lupini]|nr:hypothetical protein [Paenibacillus lupini]